MALLAAIRYSAITLAARVTGLPEAGFYVFIKENAMDNVGVGGQLLNDRK